MSNQPTCPKCGAAALSQTNKPTCPKCGADAVSQLSYVCHSQTVPFKQSYQCQANQIKELEQQNARLRVRVEELERLKCQFVHCRCGACGGDIATNGKCDCPDNRVHPIAKLHQSRIAELEQQNARLSAVLDQTGKDGWQVLKDATAKVTELEQQLAAAQKRHEQQVADECETDTAIRELCRPFMDVDGDKYGVPGIQELVEKLVTMLAAAQKRCESLKEHWRFWSYCTWQGILRWCPEKKEVFQELMTELGIEPYSARQWRQNERPT